jgi:hypothetical protein
VFVFIEKKANVLQFFAESEYDPICIYRISPGDGEPANKSVLDEWR